MILSSKAILKQSLNWFLGIILEGDSQAITKSIISMEGDQSEIGLVLDDISSTLVHFVTWKANWIPRTLNNVQNI